MYRVTVYRKNGNDLIYRLEEDYFLKLIKYIDSLPDNFKWFVYQFANSTLMISTDDLLAIDIRKDEE